MSFGMFVTWVLLGVLAGVLAGVLLKGGGYGLKNDIILGLVGSIGASWLFRGLGVVPGAGILTMAVVASIGAAIPILVQRKIRPTDRPGDDKGAIWRWGTGAALVTVLAWMVFGPAPQQAATATAAVIEDKTYTVAPGEMKVKAGIVTGEVTGMKVVERVEQGSDRVVTPAKLTGILRLRNMSDNQTVRLLGGKLVYVDAQGQPIKLEDARSEPTVRFSTDGDRLDPGQETTQSLDVEFPVEALKAEALKEIRLEFAYIPSAYRMETVSFPVSIRGQ